MRTEQRKWTPSGGWDNKTASELQQSAGLVLIFGATELIADPAVTREVQAAYPGAKIVGCSTAGTISGTQVSDDFLAVTAISFERTTVRIAEVNLPAAADSADCGQQLVSSLVAEDLVHMLVLSDGLNVNGGELVKGTSGALPPHVAVTGFYSSGEISPFTQSVRCELHNQTMTITTFSEAA